jgi:hypothetical protein
MAYQHYDHQEPVNEHGSTNTEQTPVKREITTVAPEKKYKRIKRFFMLSVPE